MVGIAALVCLYNETAAPYMAANSADLPFTLGLLHLPMTPWTLAAPFLSLLLVFRTNASYQRWAEARAVWGSVTNTVRDVARHVSWRSTDREEAALAIDRLAAFPWALQGHVGDPTVQGQVRPPT